MSDDLQKRYEAEFRKRGLEYETGRDTPGRIYAPHAHGWVTLVTLSGSIRLRKGNSWHDLQAGDVFEINTDEDHEGVVGADGWHWLAAWRPEQSDTFDVHGIDS